ncbi:MFS transporter [Halobium salinum]|uniref:MFS transporter n=1 Tax=Halobium salinum TaxID=1364940 RepID=A0ABD5P6X1_9EURY|nr:MFS transporter [Halobium salinum]
METVTENESVRESDSRRWWTLAIFGFVALEGATLQIQGAVLPSLRGSFGAPEWQLGLVAPAMTVGSMVFVALVGAVAGRVNTRKLLLLGTVGTGIGVFTMGLAPSFGVFLGVLVLRGAFAGVGRGSDRPLLSHLYPSRRGRLFGYYDMMWAVGAAAGPLLVAAALRVGDWRLAYYVAGAAFLPVALLVWYLPDPSVGGGDDPLTLGELRRIGRSPAVLVMAAGILLSTGVEGGLFTWLTTYAQGRLADGLVTLSLSVLLVAYVPGRFLAGTLSERFGYVPLTLGLGTCCLLSAGYTFFLASGLAILLGVFCIGLSLSGLYPTLLAYATESAPEHSAPVNALGLVVSSVGIAGTPALMGFVVDGSGAAAAMRLLLLPLVGLVVVAAVAWVRVGTADTASATG